MTSEQTFDPITIEGLQAKATTLRQEGWRLVQICATRLPEEMELTYSFDREGLLANYRMHLRATGARIPSITSIYWCAFLYENELHDLFNIRVDGIAVDFHGTLYKTAVKFPFSTIKAPVAKPAAVQPTLAAKPAPIPVLAGQS